MPTAAPSPPARSDVVVIGAGLAGLSIARRLAERGIGALVLDASSHAGEGSASAAGIGLVEVGTPDLFLRTVGLLGEKAATTVHEFSRRNADLIEHLGRGYGAGYGRAGAFNLTTEPAELAELKESSRLLARQVPSAAPWEILEDIGEVASRTRTEGFIGGVLRPDDARLDAALFLERLATDAVSRRARIHRGVEVSGVTSRQGRGLGVHTTTGDIEAEMVVLAAGAGGVGLHGILRERVVPVLGQGVSLAGLPAPTDDELRPVSTNFGHLRARVVPRLDGADLVAWNIPWSLKGSDPEGRRHVVVPEQQERIERYLHAHFPSSRARRENGVGRRWAAHLAYTVDNLPLTGPVPGEPRLLLCTGFSGHEWGLACYAASVVADGIAGDVPPEGFELFSARRFISG